MIRFASKPACGPAVSSSAALAPPAAFAPPAPDASAPAVASDGGGGGVGLGCLLAQATPRDAINIIIRSLRIHPSPTYPPRVRQRFSLLTGKSPAPDPTDIDGSLNERP